MTFSHLSLAISLRDYDKAPRSGTHLSKVVKKIEKEDLHKNLLSFIKNSRPSRMITSKGHKSAREYIVKYINSKTNKSGQVSIDSFSPDLSELIDSYKLKLSKIKASLEENKFKAKIDTKVKDKDKSKDQSKDKELLKVQNFTQSSIDFFKKSQGLKGHNIIWEKTGRVKPDEYLILGANYDTMNIDQLTYELKPDSKQPGADNNGSSVSVLLSLIELFSELELKRSIMIVFFDFDEVGQLGLKSFYKKYIDDNKSKKIKAYFHLKMLGHDSKINDKKKRYGNMLAYTSHNSQKLYDIESSILKEFYKYTRFINKRVRFDQSTKDFIYPDSSYFRRADIPTIIFSQDIENDYNKKRINTENDFPETLNIKTLYASYKYLAQATSYWLLDL